MIPGPASRRILPSLAATLLLGACVAFTPDGSMAPVASRVSLELGKDTVKITSAADEIGVGHRVQALLAKPLTADAAVQVALLNNRGLQAEYNALGISEADYVAATLPPINPALSVERALTEWEFGIERSLAVELVQLAYWPKRKAIAATSFEAAQYRAIEATFRTAADTRRAFYEAVGARQRVGFLGRARQTASLAAELTIKLGETGAATRGAQARASAFYAEVSAELAQARLDADRAREALTRRMGLWGTAAADFKLPSSLPKLPKLRTVAEVEADAVRRRVDLIAARLELDATAKELGLTNATRFVSVLDLTGTGTTDWVRHDGKTEREEAGSLELHLEIPVWDFGETGRRRAVETYMQSANRFVELAVNVRSEAREAYRTYRATHDITRQYQNRVIPLRNLIEEESLLEYNGMLIDVLDLLDTERETIDSNVAAIEAKRNFFIAEVDFQAALIGGGGSGGGAGAETGGAAAVAEAGGH
ncbi:TolC family protein [Methylobrevis pamukkalensis]|uniref:Outer membrane efflux protein n=1 Tax=Methylobrevis pamukkalensis TaxID=1439726 RepID=A0A1E3H545_9HYPH|nr:TolC family protein [Methylobrevis pamukkalensis]ODN71457.1 Outer membrane efflux protein [Methylobrevis pamukkalensis]